jgi:hypothetical protein
MIIDAPGLKKNFIASLGATASGGGPRAVEGMMNIYTKSSTRF